MANITNNNEISFLTMGWLCRMYDTGVLDCLGCGRGCYKRYKGCSLLTEHQNEIELFLERDCYIRIAIDVG